MSTESLVWREFSTFSEARQFGFELNKPCVYTILDNQGKVLYVGKSIHGFGYRYLGHAGMIQALMEGSGKRIRITNVDNENLRAIELKLISALQPSYNRAGKNNSQIMLFLLGKDTFTAFFLQILCKEILLLGDSATRDSLHARQVPIK